MNKTIKNKNNGILIQGTGLNSNSNSVDYVMHIPIADIEYAVSAFTFINGATQLMDGEFVYGSTQHIPNLPDILSSSFVENSDVGLSGTDILKNFSASIIFNTNALSLNMDEWELVNV